MAAAGVVVVAAAAAAAVAMAGVAEVDTPAAAGAAAAMAAVGAMVAALVMLAAVGAVATAATGEAMVGAMVAVAITAQWRAVTAAAMVAITAQWRAVTAAAMAITAQWRAMTAAATAMPGPGGVDQGSPRAARVAISSTVIVIDSLSVTTVGIGSSTAASRTEATTLTASIIGIGYLGTASGSGPTAPITTPTTIAGGYADRPSLRGARIGGAAITTASAIIKLTSAQKRPREGGAFFLRLNRIGAVALAAQRADNNHGVGEQSASLSSAPNSRALSMAAFNARARNSARVIGPFCCMWLSVHHP